MPMVELARLSIRITSANVLLAGAAGSVNVNMIYIRSFPKEYNSHVYSSNIVC